MKQIPAANELIPQAITSYIDYVTQLINGVITALRTELKEVEKTDLPAVIIGSEDPNRRFSWRAIGQG